MHEGEPLPRKKKTVNVVYAVSFQDGIFDYPGPNLDSDKDDGAQDELSEYSTSADSEDYSDVEHLTGGRHYFDVPNKTEFNYPRFLGFPSAT